MKILVVIAIFFIGSSTLLFASESDVTFEHKFLCSIEGCLLRCSGKDEKLIFRGHADTIFLTTLKNGLNYFLLERFVSKETVIVDPKQFLCSIKNHR